MSFTPNKELLHHSRSAPITLLTRLVEVAGSSFRHGTIDPKLMMKSQTYVILNNV